jgi:hypothetical protein
MCLLTLAHGLVHGTYAWLAQGVDIAAEVQLIIDAVDAEVQRACVAVEALVSSGNESGNAVVASVEGEGTPAEPQVAPDAGVVEDASG